MRLRLWPPLGRGDFYNKHSFFSSNDFLMSEFINDDLLSALKVYYAMADDYDSLDWGNLPMCRKLKSGASGASWQIVFMGYFTTGLPQEDVGRYYYSSSYRVLKFHFILERKPPFKFLYTMCL